MSLFGFGGCKACGASESADPVKDTVKFCAEDKENMSPQMNEEEVAAAAAKEMYQRERAEAEAKKQRELEEEQKRAEEQAEEQQRQIKEEEARKQREEERREAEERVRVEEARKAAEEEQRRRQAQEAEEERISKETARLEREALEAQEAADKKKQIDDFLKQHGYASVNAKRKSKFGRYKYPLHTAVKHNPEIVPLLLGGGAESSNKNSAGLTPYEYAKKLKAPCESVLRPTS